MLRSFLADPARPEGTLTYHELQGFLFAVACSPEPIETAEWTQAVFASEDAAYASADEEAQVQEALSRMYSDITAGVQGGAPVLPTDVVIAADAMANFDETAPLCEWSRGFIAGDEWLADSWDIELPDEVAEALDTTLMLLSLFAEREQAEEAEKAGEFGDETLASLAGRAITMLPEAMKTYAMIGREVLAPAYAEAAAEPVEQRRVDKVGRNEPCPCGSGKKFKQCCGK